MPIRITCPGCKTVNTAEDAKRGKKIRCEECDKILQVPVAKKTTLADSAVQSSPKIKIKPTPQKKKPTEDDDEDDRPSTKRKAASKRNNTTQKGSSSTLLIVGGLAAVALFLMIGVGGVAAIYLFRSRPAGNGAELANIDAKREQNADGKLADGANNNKPEEKKEILPDNKKPVTPDEKKIPDPEPKKQVEPGKPLPNQIDPADVKRVKQATVYLRVTMPGGQIAEGSGFFVYQPGIIVTNAHVLGMLSSSSRPPNQVDVVVHSGDAAEFKLAGNVLGVDRESDLAVIRVPVDGKLPEPLNSQDDRALVETQGVYIFGFPFGAKLGRDITVSQSNVSSLRKKAGVLDQIQVNGGMHPGNSGGPVVNSLGNLVGVSVAGITGTQINFAVPAEKVTALMSGRIDETKWGEPFSDAGMAKLPIACKCLDPLASVREMRVETWVGQRGPTRPASFNPPKLEPGDNERQTHAVKYKDGAGQVDIDLPDLKPGEVCWVQPVIKTAKGTQWGEARSLSSKLDLLQRVPAELRASFTAQPERTSTLRSTYSSTTASGAKKTVLTESVSATLAETVTPDPRGGARVQTAYAALQIKLDRDGKFISIPGFASALNIVRTMPPVFPINDFNATSGYVKNSLNPGHPLRAIVEDLNTMVHTPFEAATIALPNRLVQPLEVFPSKSTMFFRDDRGKATILDLVLSATYEGKRQQNGRDTAVLTITGELHGRDDLKGKIEGKITGKVGVDVAGGFLSSVDLVIFADSEDTLPGIGSVRREMRNEISVSRSAGNTTGIPVATGKTPPPVGKIINNVDSALTDADPFDRVRKLSRVKVYPILMQKGNTYIISMNSNTLDPYLRLEDPDQRPVASDDDGGGGLNSRIEYLATKTGVHKIYATSFQPGTGPYQLIVQVKDGAVAKIDPNIPPPIGGQPPAGWMETRSKNGTFSVWLPKDGKFSEKEGSLFVKGAGQIRVWNMTLERADGSAYFASQIILPPNLATGSVKARHDLFRDLALRELNGQLVRERIIKVDIFGGSREYLIKTPGGLASFRLIGSGVMIFRTIVVGTIAQVESADARIFENSFRYLKGGNQPPPSKEPPVVVKENPNPVPGGGISNPNPNLFFNGDVQLRHLTFQKKGKLVGDVIWAADGKSFFMLDEAGLLQRINVTTGHTEQFLEINAPCSGFSLSGEGLLVAVPGANELWIVDPDKLGNIKKKIAIQNVARVSSGRSASVAIISATPASSRNVVEMQTLDLKTGSVLKIHSNLRIFKYAVSPDGKYVCVLGGIEQLIKYRIDGANLVEEDSTHRIATNGQSICFSPDSKYVALPSGGGNGSRHPEYLPELKNYATLIFPIDNLKKAASGYAAGGYPRTVGIDPKSGILFGQSHDRPLLVYSFNKPDQLIGNYQFPIKGRGDTVGIVVSPLFGEAIVRMDSGELVHVKINKGSAPPAAKEAETKLSVEKTPPAPAFDEKTLKELSGYVGVWEGKLINYNESLTVKMDMGKIVISGEFHRNGKLYAKYDGRNIVVADGKIQYDQAFSVKLSPVFYDSQIVMSLSGNDRTISWQGQKGRKGVLSPK